MPLWLFAFVAALAVFSALGVVLQRNPVHSLMSLVITLLAIAVLFIGLGAVTLGFLQAIVYVGAIMVLFLFVIWLLNIQALPADSSHLMFKLFGTVAAAALVAELLVFFAQGPMTPAEANLTPEYGSISQLAMSLFSDYLVAFEVTSVLLLAAVAGAIALARRVPQAPETGGARAEGGAARSEGW